MSPERPPKKRTGIESLDLVRRRMGAIKRARELSQMLIVEHPEIAEDYRTIPATELRQKYFPDFLQPDDTDDVYYKAIQLALTELLGTEEKLIQASKHQRSAVSRTAKQLYQEGRGIHALPPEQKIAIARKGGTISGQRQKELGIGVAHQSLEKRLAATHKSHESRGIAPYIGSQQETEYGPLEERDYIIRLKDDLEFSRRGGWKGLLDHVNTVFGNNRKIDDVRNIYYRSKRS